MMKLLCILGLNMMVLACASSQIVYVYPDSVITDVANHPVGINLDFFMDGGRFPKPDHTVQEAVAEMGMKYLRYPGGEKSDLYLFGKPPYEKSEPGAARSGGLDDYPGMFTEDLHLVYDPLDFDEYIQVCRAVKAEPVVVVAADYYLIPLKTGEWVNSKDQLLQHAVEWVRYANIKKKYGVRYWMIANESWNSNNVNSTPEIYARDVIDFSKAMKEVDSTILIIANGASDAYFRTVITRAGDYIDRLTVSNYGVYNFYRGYQTYRDTAQVLIWPAITAVNAVNAYASPEQLQRLKVIVAEYGSIDWAGLWHGTNDMGHAIVTFDMTGQLLLQPQIEFSCFWNTRWIENGNKPGRDHDALDEKGNLYPTGRALSIWGKFLGSQMVKSLSTGNVLTFASYDPATNTLFTYLINKAEKPETVSLEIENKAVMTIEESWEFFGKSSEDIHPVWQQIQGLKPGKPIALKGYSITLVKMRVKNE